jgi:putative PEP-CTERM system histidine kinase
VNTIGAFGYAAVGTFYALLTVLLLTTWRGHRVGIYLILASIVSAVWGFSLAAQMYSGSVYPLLVALLEVSRATIWILFLVRLVSQIGMSRWLRLVPVLTCVAVAASIIYQVVLGAIDPVLRSNLAATIVPGGLAMALVGLILIEQLYRNASTDTRWSLKPLVLGVGGIFAFDLFIYSQGVLLGSLDATTWAARGLVNILFVPLIAIAARRNTEWEMRIFVSRHVIFYSTTLMATGLYLLLMSFGGYLIVRFGGTWGGLVQIVFFAGAVVVLMTLLFSSSLRARSKVFLNKHFFHNKYDYREEWMRLVTTLASFDKSSAQNVAIKALAQIVNSPAGAIWVRDASDSTFRFEARIGTEFEFPDIAPDESVIQFIEEDMWLVDIDEYARNPEQYGNMQLPEWIAARNTSWLLVPLQTADKLLGIILLDKAPGPPRLNYEDRDLLKTVGNHIAVHLAQARSDSLLAEARQFEAYNRTTAFLMHDLNNLIAQQSLIVANAEKHKRNPEFVDDAISTIAGSVERMKRVMKQLKSADMKKNTKLTDLKFVVSAAVDRSAVIKPNPILDLNDVEARVATNEEEFIMVLAHVIRNAQDACSEDGTVTVGLHRSDSLATITVSDDGAGMSSDFVRDRLFRPFDSTKGNQGMGIGAYQAREFARQMGGDLAVDSRPGEGTRVSISVPIS